MQNTDAASNMQAEVAGAVRAELARHQRSQTQLARHLGLSQQAVSRRLRGEIAFDVAELAAVAEFLEVPVTALLPSALAA